MAQDPIYLDHAATTPVRPEVFEAMRPYLGLEAFGNPSSAHASGRAARAGLDRARREIAEALGVGPRQVIFTSGGTEADNLAILGLAHAPSTTAAVGATEHKAVLAAAHHVAHHVGSELLLPVDPSGVLHLEALDEALARRPAVVSVMWVNNETGIIQPVAAIADRCHTAGVPFHTDAVQACGRVPMALGILPPVLVTLSGHKLGAPKGIGALIVPEGLVLAPQVHGGGQQGGIRPGTENVPGAVGLGRAVALAVAEQHATTARLTALRDDLQQRLLTAITDLVIHGEQAPRAPHILSVGIPGTDSEALLMHLDLAGLAASSGSACTTGAVEPSHVMQAMGVPHHLAVATIRLSLGWTSTAEDVSRAATIIPAAVARVRQLGEVLGRV